MGLDMYLMKKTYIGAKYEHRKITGKVEIFQNNKLLEIDFNKISEIIESVGYWRKANQIHNWFVQNVQDGVDDCNEYHVDFEQLQDLKELCQKVLETKQTDLLEPQSGFFFGSTEIDEYYYQDLKDTIEIIDNLDKNGEYYYQASW